MISELLFGQAPMCDCILVSNKQYLRTATSKGQTFHHPCEITPENGNFSGTGDEMSGLQLSYYVYHTVGREAG